MHRPANVHWSQTKKPGQSDVLYWLESPNKWVWIGIFKPAELHSPWAACYAVCLMAYSLWLTRVWPKLHKISWIFLKCHRIVLPVWNEMAHCRFPSCVICESCRIGRINFLAGWCERFPSCALVSLHLVLFVYVVFS